MGVVRKLLILAVQSMLAGMLMVACLVLTLSFIAAGFTVINWVYLRILEYVGSSYAQLITVGFALFCFSAAVVFVANLKSVFDVE